MSQVMETDDFLEHHGVKGMRWGVRRARDGVVKTATKIGEHDTRVKNARLAEESRQNAIKGARRQVKRSTKAFSDERKAGRVDLKNMKLDLLNHPDHATAMRMTSGELLTATILGKGETGYYRELAAQKVEKRQASGYYTAKKR